MVCIDPGGRGRGGVRMVGGVSRDDQDQPGVLAVSFGTNSEYPVQLGVASALEQCRLPLLLESGNSKRADSRNTAEFQRSVPRCGIAAFLLRVSRRHGEMSSGGKEASDGGDF